MFPKGLGLRTEGERKTDWDLTCPRDGSVLEKVRVTDVTVDRCTACGGHWFDAGELRRVAESAELEKIAAHVAPGATGSKFGCPRCWGDCFESYIGPIQADACSSCRGVWLDAGELEEAKREIALRPQPKGFLAFLKRL